MEQQLEDLACLGLYPDQIRVQSQARQRHWQVFRDAVRAGAVYPCFCSRKQVLEDLRQSASAPHSESHPYSGRCRPPGSLDREPELPVGSTLAWRLRVSEEGSGKQDFLVARTRVVPAPDLGGLFAEENADSAGFIPGYNWACAIDDADGGYAWLVRAWDLAHVASQQRLVQRLLKGPDFAGPLIYHCALVTANDGTRLEKRTRGVTLPELQARGLSSGELTRRFARSFTDSSASRVSESGGEGRRSIPLSELVPG